MLMYTINSFWKKIKVREVGPKLNELWKKSSKCFDLIRNLTHFDNFFSKCVIFFKVVCHTVVMDNDNRECVVGYFEHLEWFLYIFFFLEISLSVVFCASIIIIIIIIIVCLSLSVSLCLSLSLSLSS